MLRGAQVHVQPYAEHGGDSAIGVGADLRQHAADLPAVQQHVVWPLERARQAGERPHRIRRREGARDAQQGRGFRGRVQQHGRQQAVALAGHPAPREAAAPGGLLLSHDGHAMRRLRFHELPRHVHRGRDALEVHHLPTDGPALWLVLLHAGILRALVASIASNVVTSRSLFHPRMSLRGHCADALPAAREAGNTGPVLVSQRFP